MNEVMKSLGISADDIRIVDGSGLARHNYISPSFFVRFLSAMMDSPSFADYIQTIAQPGSRHYESRLRESPASVKSRVHLKSGSMNGVQRLHRALRRLQIRHHSLLHNDQQLPSPRLPPGSHNRPHNHPPRHRQLARRRLARRRLVLCRLALCRPIDRPVIPPPIRSADQFALS